MNKKDFELKNLLDMEVNSRNNECELTQERPDPLFIAKRYNDEYISLICALFAYGKASLIIKFLDSLDFSLLDEDEKLIRKTLKNIYYRFQNSEDVIKIFQTFRNMKQEYSLNEIFKKTYIDTNSILEALDALISKIHQLANYESQGFKFLVSSPFKRDKDGKIKHIGNAPYKRWFMYLRWMIREDNLDLGLWSGIDKKDLILPLDTHTFNVSKRIGLIQRKNCDLYASYLLTTKLKEFDKNDPIKYDFALYRIGQEKLI